MQSFVALSELGRPETGQSAVGTFWDLPLLAGPQTGFDLSAFPAPFAIQQ